MKRRMLGEPGALGQAVWATLATAASASIAAVGAWPVYDSPRVGVVVAVGALLGIGAVWLGRGLGWRAWASAAAAAVGFLLIAVPVAIPSAMTNPGRFLRGVANAGAAIVLGWKRLLTIELPAGEYQAVLVPLLIVVVACTCAAMALATSGGRFAPFGALPMLAMAGFGPTFGSASVGEPLVLAGLSIPAPRETAVAMAALVVTATWLLGRARLDRQVQVRLARSRATSTVRQGSESALLTLRRQVFSGLLVVLALGAAVAAAPVAERLGPREALREDIAPLLVLERQPSPLSSYRASFAGDSYDAVLFTIDGQLEVDRLRIATLDTFDGQTFHVGGATSEVRFTRQAQVQDGQVRITIGPAFSGVWVPIADADAGAPVFSGPRAEELSEAYYASADLDAGVVVTGGADAGTGLIEADSYRISASGAPDASEGFGSAKGTDPLISAEAYPNLAAWVDAQELGRSGGDLEELVARLTSRGYLSHGATDDAAAQAWIAALPGYSFEPSRSGHSAARVEELFADLLDQQRRAGANPGQQLLVAGVGDEEQFATAAALVARYLGFESRVVIGVRTADDGSGLPFCTTECTGADITAWTEVRQVGGAWVALGTTPQFSTPPTAIELGTELPKNPTQVQQPASEVLEPPAAEADSTAQSNNAQTEPAEVKRSGSRLLISLGLGAAAAGIAALPGLVFPIAKSARRAARRRASVPELAIVSAWEELVDTYADLRIDVPRRLTRAETADVLERPLAASLAALVDRAVFAEHPPVVEQAQLAWQLVDEERKELLGGAGVRQRVRAAFTLRSLLRAVRSDHATASHLAGGTHHDL